MTLGSLELHSPWDSRFIIEDSWTSGYTPRYRTDHGDGRISGDTMNVYIPRYEPESDINILIKPSVINIQPLMEVE